MKGLLIGNEKEKYGNEWLNLILSGEKTGEVRGTKTTIRGTIALVESGTNLILGMVDIVDVISVFDAKHWEELKYVHRVAIPFSKLKYSCTYVWLLENPVKFDTPVACENRKPGQVVWINDAISK